MCCYIMLIVLQATGWLYLNSEQCCVKAFNKTFDKNNIILLKAKCRVTFEVFEKK